MANHRPAGAAAPRRLDSLSARELQVLAMTAQGYTNGQIADRLEVTVHGVKFHLASVFKKLGVTNRTEAAVVFLGGVDQRGMN